MAVKRFGSRDRPSPHGLPQEGESMAEVMLAEASAVQADLGMIVARSARRYGPRPALVADGRTLTYQDLHELCDRVAGGLQGLGVRPGDRVSLYSPNRWEWVVAYHAALRAGAVVNPINVMLTPEEVAFVLNDCGAAVIFTAGEKAEVIVGLTRAVPTLRRVISFDPAAGDVTLFADLLAGPPATQQAPRPAPADLSTIGYTSGTTGHPKGAMQSHRAVFLNTAALFAVQTRTERDVMVNALPLPHVYGNVVMNGTFMVGATLVMMERFDPALALAEIERHHATVFDGVPTMYAMMLADPSMPSTDLSSLRICAVGGQDDACAKNGGVGGPVRGAAAGAVGNDRTGRRGHQQLQLYAQRARLDRLRSAWSRSPRGRAARCDASPYPTGSRAS